MITTIIFDYGNVISLTNTGDCSAQMQKMTGVPAAVFQSVYDRFRFEFDRGTINGAEMYKQLLIDDGYTEVAQDTELMKKIALLDLESWKDFHKDVTKWALDIKKQGYKLGILSNMPYEFLDLYEKSIPLFTKADYACFSCRVKLIKPEKEIYYNCLNGLHSKPEECVFFDDLQENIDAANEIGINGFVWTGLEQAKKDWDSIIKKQL
ncbi:MAG: haloacid dehalogenase [Treponema sp. CETP13]|nr:MAG: haloacid dehalogenase [Treponema sp. CETP13]